jgi:squalene-hopene/tetraprenyl-beta-curcumene cyclase
MKKPLVIIIAILMILPMITIPPLAVKASQGTNQNVLTSNTEENLTILGNGIAQVALSIAIPDSQLAEMYQKSLQSTTAKERDEAIKQEQYYALSLELFQFGPEKVEKGINGEFMISGTGFAALQVTDFAQTPEGTTWEITFGPVGQKVINDSASFFFTQTALAQLMLRSIQGEESYETSWSTRMNLPAGAVLVNAPEIASIDSLIDFGGGTYSRLSATIEDGSTIVINEMTVVTRNDITANNKDLYEAFAAQRTFKIKYSVPDLGFTYAKAESICQYGSDPAFDWSMPLWPVKPYTLKFEDDTKTLSADLTVTPSLSLNGHIGWEVGSSFEAWMSIDASIKAEFEAKMQVSVKKTLGPKDLFAWKTTYWFWVGLMPVWADLQMAASASVELEAEASLTLTAEAEVGGRIKAGVSWTSGQGWSPIAETPFSAEHSGPTISVEGKASVTASIELDLALLIFGAAGPHVALVPYATAELTVAPPPAGWDIKAGVKLVAGAKFAGWLKDLLNLENPEDYTLYDKVIPGAEWTGTMDQAKGNDFFITANPNKQLFEGGEKVTVEVDVTNCMSEGATFSLGASFMDPIGEYKKYDSQIAISPPGYSLLAGKTVTFSVEWTLPSDAPAGYYQIALNCWKGTGHEEQYTDNIMWETILYVYKFRILTPTASEPANAADPTLPRNIQVSAEWIPTFLLTPLLIDTPTFSVTIGGKPAQYTVVDPLSRLFGIYTLEVNSPSQANEGLYNLDVTASFGELVGSDTKTNAVKYTAGPSMEPVEKGLAWLRTQQNPDGSWYDNVGVTALCALSFMNSGYDESDVTVQKATGFLISNAHSDGTICNDFYATYETSLALIALVATHNTNYQSTMNSARDWLINSQWDENCVWGSVDKANWYYGGFGYGEESRPDLSNTQFALMALDAVGLAKDSSTWVKAQVFLHRCQNVNFAISLNIDGNAYTVDPYNTYGGYDGGFIYTPGVSLAGGETSYGSMTGAGLWGLLLCGVPKSDPRVVAAMDWVTAHYSWDTNPGVGWWRMFYYYLSMSKALTMHGETLINGQDWYPDLYAKIVGMQIDAGSGKGYWTTTSEDMGPDLTTAYAILALQTRAVAPPVQRLSYLTFILRSNCLIRFLDSGGNLVGYNYMMGTGVDNIPTAVYSGPNLEPQYIAIVNPKPGTYKLELVGISEGPYTLTIQGSYGKDVTKTFEYTGEISPGELYGSQVTVAAIVGPIDVYTDKPQFEKIIDNIPPTTTLTIGDPKYVSGRTCVTPDTPFALAATDTGSGVNSTAYRITNSASYDSGWLTYVKPFNLTSLRDGNYTIAFNSTDNVGNVEDTNSMNVTLVGPDINGDGEVNLKDYCTACNAFGSYPGHPRWNPAVDINLDGHINLIDIFRIVVTFGKHYP